MSSSKTTVGAACLLLVALCIFFGLRESSKPPIGSVHINPIPVSSHESKNIDDSVSDGSKKADEDSLDVSEAMLAAAKNTAEDEVSEEAIASDKDSKFEYKKIKDPRKYGCVYGCVVDQES